MYKRRLQQTAALCLGEVVLSRLSHSLTAIYQYYAEELLYAPKWHAVFLLNVYADISRKFVPEQHE